MWKLGKSRKCATFIDAVETAPTEIATAEALLQGLPPDVGRHTTGCADCAAYLADLVTTRNTVRSGYPAAANFDAPWFAARVIARI